MYKDFGKYGTVNARSYRYAEDRRSDEECGYKYGFDICPLPCVRISNTASSILVAARFLAWEIVWFKFKKIKTKH